MAKYTYIFIVQIMLNNKWMDILEINNAKDAKMALNEMREAEKDKQFRIIQRRKLNKQ